MKMLLLFSLFIAGNALAEVKIDKVDVYPLFQTATCADGDFDYIGKFGLINTKRAANVYADRISLIFDYQMIVCTDLGAHDRTKMKWVKVDPFEGFEVPYYNPSHPNEPFRQIILSSNPKNNFEMRLHWENDYKLLAKTNMIQKGDGTIEGTVTIPFSHMLDQHDLALLNQGQEVSKRFELDQRSVMTRFYPHSAKNEVSDIRWSSRFIKFTFVKENNQIKLQSFSID